MTMKLKKTLILLFQEYQNVNHAVMYKWNKVVILLNDSNVVVIVLYFAEKFVKDGCKNFGLNMT